MFLLNTKNFLPSLQLPVVLAIYNRKISIHFQVHQDITTFTSIKIYTRERDKLSFRMNNVGDSLKKINLYRVLAETPMEESNNIPE